MRVRYLVPLVLLLAACATQTALCPADSTKDIDATITQVTYPSVTRPATLATAGGSRATVQFAITVTNRTNEPMRVRSITLTQPTWFPRAGETSAQECFGVDRLNADVATVSQGFDRSVAPGASATFDLRTIKGFNEWDPLMNNPTVLSVDIRTETPSRTRSDRLTRKVVLNVAENGKHS
jgi:hypothetical protein